MNDSLKAELLGSFGDDLMVVNAARVSLAKHHVDLQVAKILTLGERVEDSFLVKGASLAQSRVQLQLEAELLDAIALPR